MGELAQVRAAEQKPILAGRSRPVHVLLVNAEMNGSRN